MQSHGIIAIIIKGNKFLLLKDSRKLMKGYWAPPHGRYNFVKDLREQDCVIREVWEETNLKVDPIRKLLTTKADTKIKTVSFWLTKIKSGKLKLNKKESSDYGWFSLEEIFKLKLYPGTKKFFNLIKIGEIKI